MAPRKKISRSRDLPDKGSYGESVGQIITEVGGPDAIAGHEAMLREHMKKEAIQYTRQRRAARLADEKNRGGRGKRIA
jgi:hypothetical protein